MEKTSCNFTKLLVKFLIVIMIEEIVDPKNRV